MFSALASTVLGYSFMLGPSEPAKVQSNMVCKNGVCQVQGTKVQRFKSVSPFRNWFRK